MVTVVQERFCKLFQQTRLAMLSTSLAVAVVFFAVTVPETVELTPETMAEHKFSIYTKVYPAHPNDLWPTSAAARKLPNVRVHFIPYRGSAIDEVESATLVIQKGDEAELSVPVTIGDWLGNDGGKLLWWRMNEQSLANAKLYLQTKDGATFVLAPKDFLRKDGK